MSLQALDPSISKAAQSIQGMPPDKALEYLEAYGLPLSTAVAIMQNSALKQHAAQQQQMQGAQAQQPSVKDKLAQQVKEAADQHAANEARHGGIADLPVPSTMFGDSQTPQTVGMARGGIVAFDDGGDVGTPPQGVPVAAWAAMTPAQKQSFIAETARKKAEEDAHMQTQAALVPGVIQYSANPFANTGPSVNPASFSLLNSGTTTFGDKTGIVERTPPAGAGTGQTAPTTLTPNATTAATAGAVRTTPTSPSSDYDAQRQAENVLGISNATSVHPELHSTLHNIATKLTDKKTASAALNTKGTPSVAPIDPNDPDNIFAGGDPTKIYQNLTANLQKEIKDHDPGDREAFIKDRISDKNEENKPTQDYLQWLQGQKDNISQRTGQNKWLALSQAGFAMAAAATKNPHGGFLGALAAGGEEGGQSYIKGLSDIRQAETDLVKSQYAARQHLVDGADASYEKEAAKALDAKVRLQGIYTKFADTQLANSREEKKDAAELMRTNIMAGATRATKYEPFNNLVFNAISAANPNMTPTEILKQMPQYLTAELGAETRKNIAAGRSVSELIRNPVYPGMPGYDAYNAELADAKARENGGGAPAPTAYQEGMTASDPSGQKIVYRGGKWVPA